MELKELKDLYKKYSAEGLFSILLSKWMIRALTVWILSALIFRFTPLEFAIALIPLLAYTTWRIRGEWRQYKQWLTSKEGRASSNSMK